MSVEETQQQRFKEFLQEIYVIGQESEIIQPSDFIIEIKEMLSKVLGKSN